MKLPSDNESAGFNLEMIVHHQGVEIYTFL